jgi:hypothetical protein
MKVRLYTIDQLYKSQVQGFIRYKKGKMEHVSPYSRVTPEKSAEAVQKFNTEVKAPYVNTQYSRLGGTGRESIIVTVSLDDRKDWYNGILHNSRYAMFHLGYDGVMEKFSGSRTNKFRKTKFKSVEDAIDKINKFVSSHKVEQPLKGKIVSRVEPDKWLARVGKEEEGELE